MPEVHDLHAAFAELERLAPTEAGAGASAAPTIDLMPAARRHHPRRRMVVVSAAGIAAAVAAVATVSAGVWSGDRHGNRAAGGGTSSAANAPVAPVVPSSTSSSATATKSASAPPPAPAKFAKSSLPTNRNSYAVGPLPDGLRVFVTWASDGYQEVTLQGATEDDANLVLGSATSWHPPIPKGATAVLVNGRHGYYYAHFDVTHAPPILGRTQTSAPGVAWQGASGKWAFLTQIGPLGGQSDPPAFSKAKLVAVANAFQVDASQSVKTPVSFGYLPGGQQLTMAGTIYRPVKGADPDVDVRYTFAPTSGSYALNMEIEQGTALMDEEGVEYDSAPQIKHIAVNGWSGYYSPQDPSLTVTNGKVSVYLTKGAVVGPGNGIPLVEVTKILKELKAAPSVSDHATWFNLENALP
jgi:hypothetical protein